MRIRPPVRRRLLGPAVWRRAEKDFGVRTDATAGNVTLGWYIAL